MKIISSFLFNVCKIILDHERIDNKRQIERKMITR